MTSFAILIIGEKDTLRSLTLQALIEDSDFQKLVSFIDPVFLQYRTIPRILDFYCSLHYGNQLTLGEWGCSLAHLNAQNYAVELGVEWVLILEDDAELVPGFKESLNELLIILDDQGRTYDAIQCFVETSGVDVSYSNGGALEPLSHHGVLQTGAVGYALHVSILDLCRKRAYKGFPIGKADFPAWSHLATWRQLQRPLVTHQAGAPSLVGERIKASASRGIFFKFGHALIRLVLSAIPFFQIPKRFQWELGHFSNRRKSP